MDFCHYSYFKSTSKTKAGLGKNESLNDHGAFLTGPGVQSVVWLQFYILQSPAEYGGAEQHRSVKLIFFLILFSNFKKTTTLKQNKNITTIPLLQLTAYNSIITDSSEGLLPLPADVPPDLQQEMVPLWAFLSEIDTSNKDWRMGNDNGQGLQVS